MKFFLDSANLGEIREAVELGMIDGVTTNPSLISKEGGVDFKEHIAAVCELVAGDVSAEVTSLDTEGMLREGREYARIAPNVIIKCPLTRDGLKATRELTAEGIRVNVTLCFSAAQAILAAKAGAAYISPFVGRLDDVGQNGIAVLNEIVEIYRNYEWRTQVLASSIRHPIHAIEAARAGAHVATMPFKVLGQLFNHPLTDKGLEQFLSDWHKGGRK
ncbi:MAG TPA: fructose-6-phosphate aldolase [Pyrinomonadaceae bacterium]|nr:fructose-6-phosphate aldolase [Pyrinomonadaceae bacterium]